MDDSRSAITYFDQHRPRATAVLPVLKAMSGELLAQVGEEQLRALFRATGAQIGESYPVGKIERLGELEQVAQTWLASNDWGWLKIEHHEDAVDFVHGDSPLVAWFGEAGLPWSSALFEGLYAAWIRQLGADERLQLHQVRLADRPVQELRYRLSHESRFTQQAGG
eukprot:TRINITY_DN10618_c0_g1_i1.p1 TRINITY_DN10618_c0_g1~~TRINITY_DN10618_c0_g1_i1.p1  ORF type:complete len:166 (-),score=26.84 TRINITY_DN10618_c0_g1_i1:35-532(-)